MAASRMEEFREFIGRYPKIRDDVRSGKRTWQNIYEEWVLYGETDPQWTKYFETQTNQSDKKQNQQENQNTNDKNGNISLNMNNLKQIYGYIKNVNPDSLNRTLNSVQKVIQIVQTFSGKTTPTLPGAASAFSDWWD